MKTGYYEKIIDRILDDSHIRAGQQIFHEKTKKFYFHTSYESLKKSTKKHQKVVKKSQNVGVLTKYYIV